MRKATRAVVPGWRLPVIRPLTAIGITVAVVTLLLGPYAQPWWSQRSQLNTTQQQVDDLQHQVDQLVAERARWNDPNYVRTQARGRLRYVMPGQTGYVLLDDAGVALSAGPRPGGTGPAGTLPAGTGPAGTLPAGTGPAGTLPAAAAGQAWYTTVWQSLQAAGSGTPTPSAGAVASATP